MIRAVLKLHCGLLCRLGDSLSLCGDYAVTRVSYVVAHSWNFAGARSRHPHLRLVCKNYPFQSAFLSLLATHHFGVCSNLFVVAMRWAGGWMALCVDWGCGFSRNWVPSPAASFPDFT